MDTNEVINYVISSVPPFSLFSGVSSPLRRVPEGQGHHCLSMACNFPSVPGLLYDCFFVCVCVHQCVLLCVFMREIDMFVHIFMHVYLCVWVGVHLCMCVHVCVCVCVCVCVYVCMCGRAVYRTGFTLGTPTPHLHSLHSAS